MEFGIYHDERPGFVDDLSLGQRRAVAVEYPEERDHARVGVDLALQIHVHVAHLTRSWRTRYPRTVCVQKLHFFSLLLRYFCLHRFNAASDPTTVFSGESP